MNTIQVHLSISFFLLVGVLNAQGIINGNFDLGRFNGWTEKSTGNFKVISSDKTLEGICRSTIYRIRLFQRGQLDAKEFHMKKKLIS